ncbi:hypothetical protein [Oricola sp.]|uniref:hypothetical protein n=1 Tax=Oricola sp. TaxID=1979950 RepID=UPI003BAB6CDF
MNIKGKWEFQFEPTIFGGDGNLYMGFQREDGRRELVKPFTLELQAEHGLVIDPTLKGGFYQSPGGATGFLQSALDEAWRIGLRPTGHDSSQTEFDALARHLEDMRAISFAKLRVEKP